MLLVRKYKIRDNLQWRDYSRIPNSEISNLTLRLILRKDFQKMIDECCQGAIYMEHAPSYQERLSSVIIPPEAMTEVRRYTQNYMDLMTHHGFDPIEAYDRILKTLCITKDNASKKRTVYFTGQKNAGKSSLIMLLTSLYEFHEVGTFQTDAESSRFQFDELLGKEFYVGDEVKACQGNIHRFLLLLEGNDNSVTELKNISGKHRLRAKPVIVAGNHHIFANCQSYADPVLARVQWFHLRNPVPDTMDLRPPRSLYPYILKRIALEIMKARRLPIIDTIEPNGEPIVDNMPSAYQDFDLD